MKILHIITRLILGGAQQNTVMSCAAQAAVGHKVWLAFGPIYGPEGSLLDEASRCGAVLEPIPNMRRSVSPFHDWRCYAELRRLIRRLKPDVVHTHSSKAGIVGRAAAWRESVPAVIHTIHGLAFHDRQAAIERHMYIAAERWAGKRCHRLIGLTHAMCDTFKRLGIGAGRPFDVVPSGVDVARFSGTHETRYATRRAFGIAATAAVLGLAARLDRFKGHDDLLDVLGRLIEHRPDLRVLLVGDGYHRPAVERRIRREGWEDRVIMAGLIPLSQVPSLYSTMDIMVLPSYQEGQGRTLVEGLLCGCGIVAYDTGGIGEVCIDQRTGRLVRTGDKNGLADAILWMLDHPSERRHLTEAGRQHVTEQFSAEKMVRRLERIYEDAVQPPPP